MEAYNDRIMSDTSTNGSQARIRVRPLSPALGAVVLGVDLARLDDAEFAEIRQAFIDHQVLFFRDQGLSPDALLGFAERFGPLADYPFAAGLADFPRITEIVKEPHQTSAFGGMWHSDTTYLAEPPMATLLYAVETPEAGGDTLFADLYAALEGLSPGLRSFLRDLTVVNTSDLHRAALRGDHLRSGSMAAKSATPAALEARHPVIRRHPQTGREVLNVNPAHSRQFADWTLEESRPLLAFLFDQATRPELTCRFRWRPGSLAVWDNRCTWHRAINDTGGRRRVMRRVSIQGDGADSP